MADVERFDLYAQPAGVVELGKHKTFEFDLPHVAIAREIEVPGLLAQSFQNMLRNDLLKQRPVSGVVGERFGSNGYALATRGGLSSVRRTVVDAANRSNAALLLPDSEDMMQSDRKEYAKGEAVEFGHLQLVDLQTKLVRGVFSLLGKR